MTDYKWHPIEALSDKDRSIDLGDLRPLYDSWRMANEKIRKASAESLKRFTDKLIRSLSIETGILERLYDLDRGTTEALVLHGFVEDLVSRSSTNIEPSFLIDILRDQEAAIRLVTECVAKKRPLSKSVIHELHGILTKHQETTKAIDQFGERREISLRRGAFKELPNNPRRPNGAIHEYCPPIHVESEMDNLLTWYAAYEHEDPLIVTAWLHHRFTQIHPYQDGNGRVARALSTLVLLKSELLPLVLDRDLRTDYIAALESADQGDLTSLCTIFATLERRAILQALSVDIDAEIERDRSITKAVIESISAKFQRRKLAKDEELRKVNSLASSLRAYAQKLVKGNLNDLRKTVRQVGDADIHIADGGPDHQNEHWFKFQVVESSKSTGKWVNFGEAHYFSKATIRAQKVRLVFVVSLHHIGRELSGIMEITAFAHLEFFDDEEDRNPASEKYFPCSLEPFVITWNTSEEDVLGAYRRWLDASLAIAVKEWGDQL